MYTLRRTEINMVKPCGVNVPKTQIIVTRNKSELLDRYLNIVSQALTRARRCYDSWDARLSGTDA